MRGSWKGAIAVGAAVGGLALLSSFWLRPSDAGSAWMSTVLSLLLGATIAGVVRVRGGSRERLQRLVALAGDEDLSVARPAGLVGAVGIGALIGTVIIPLFEGDAGILFRLSAWTTGLVWSLVVLIGIFGSMAWLAAWNMRLDAWIEREVTPKVPVNLLDLGSLAEFGRRGIESAGFWIVNSSIASLLFVLYPFSILHFTILSITMGIGAAVLLRPMLGIRRRIADAKAAELRAVREAIHEARARQAYDERLPAMLAWEARVATVSPWPFDAGSALRAGALGLLAIGSWVGGALIERLVEATLG